MMTTSTESHKIINKGFTASKDDFEVILSTEVVIVNRLEPVQFSQVVLIIK